MTCSKAISLCLLTALLASICSGLVLDRLPKHVKRAANQELAPEDEDDATYDADQRRIIQDYHELSPNSVQSSWKALPSTSGARRQHRERKRSAADAETAAEIARMLKDDENYVQETPKKKPKSAEIIKKKTKRQLSDEATPEAKEEDAKDEKNEEFQEWLRREYYRNMAKSFASMRRKRESPSLLPRLPARTKKGGVQQGTTTLEQITDNLRDIEDQLFEDALQTMRSSSSFDEDSQRQNRIVNDLSLAYDLETMRGAFFRLKETLTNMEEEEEDSAQMRDEGFHFTRKRSHDCPALNQLTSDCSSLSDIMPDGPLKRLLRKACNWHEVCYTCGKVYGLTSENCDGSFVEQTRTICRGDGRCESTASLLVVPLRQRRLFYKRSNPSVCAENACVADFLRRGIEAMEAAAAGRP